jgi:putative membrane protein
MDEGVAPFSVEPTVNNHFAGVRTVMGLQRTHMAVVRTAVALIGFGFTVAQFFGSIPIGRVASLRLGGHSARDVGLLLISAGVVLLAVATVQYRRLVAYLSSAPFEPVTALGREPAITSIFTTMTRPVYLMSSVVMLIGVAAFVSILIEP